MKLTPLDDLYPRALARLDEPPVLEVSKPLVKSSTVAIVGSREPQRGSLAIAHSLAYCLARAGITVVSGGAKGVDSAAHRAAIAAGGSTWIVACTGRDSIFPKQNRDLFREVEDSADSRMIWPFESRTEKTDDTPRLRNGVLVALADCVVVIQAALKSGSRNAIAWARRLGRPLFVVPGAPWDAAFAGSHLEGARGGVETFWSIERFFELRSLPAPDLKDPGAEVPFRLPTPPRRGASQTFTDRPRFEVEKASWSEDEKLVFSRLLTLPTQQDKIIEETGLSTSSTLTALLTLSLRDVVVEGPDGFFRRRNAL